MDLRILLLLSCLPALAGCMGGGDDAGDAPDVPTNERDGADGGAGEGGNATEPVAIASSEFMFGPAASNAVPAFNGSAVLGLSVNETFARVLVNTTVTTGSSVNLHFFGLGACAGAIESPAQPGKTYTTDCGPVPQGSYNLTYAQDSGTVVFRVEVFGIR